MNLLVTGGAGFIGSNLVHHIIDNDQIQRLVIVDCLTYAGHWKTWRDWRATQIYFRADGPRNKEAISAVVQLHDITHVMHLAAESHVDRSITGPDDFIQTNIVGTFNLLEAARGAWGYDLEGNDFSTFPPTRSMAAWGRRVISPRRRRMRPIRLIPQARRRAISWSEPITILTGCPWSRRIAPTITARANFRKSLFRSSSKIFAIAGLSLFTATA